MGQLHDPASGQVYDPTKGFFTKFSFSYMLKHVAAARRG